MPSASSQSSLSNPRRGFGGGIAQDANTISMRPAGAAGTCSHHVSAHWNFKNLASSRVSKSGRPPCSEVIQTPEPQQIPIRVRDASVHSTSDPKAVSCHARAPFSRSSRTTAGSSSGTMTRYVFILHLPDTCQLANTRDNNVRARDSLAAVGYSTMTPGLSSSHRSEPPGFRHFPAR